MSLAMVEFSIYSKRVQKAILCFILRKLTLLGMNHTAYPGLTCCYSSQDWIGEQGLQKSDLFLILVHYLQSMVNSFEQEFITLQKRVTQKKDISWNTSVSIFVSFLLPAASDQHKCSYVEWKNIFQMGNVMDYLSLGLSIRLLFPPLCQSSKVADERLWSPVLDLSASFPEQIEDKIPEEAALF